MINSKTSTVLSIPSDVFLKLAFSEIDSIKFITYLENFLKFLVHFDHFFLDEIDNQ